MNKYQIENKGIADKIYSLYLDINASKSVRCLHCNKLIDIQNISSHIEPHIRYIDVTADFICE